MTSSQTQPQSGGSVARVAAPPHAVVVVAVVVADVDLGRPGHTARAAVDLPQRLVELVNDDGEVVFPSEGHDTVVAGEGSALREAGEVRIEADVVLDKGLEVVSVLPHVAHHISPVAQVIIGVAVQLVPQRAKQAVAVSRYLPT